MCIKVLSYEFIAHFNDMRKEFVKSILICHIKMQKVVWDLQDCLMSVSHWRASYHQLSKTKSDILIALRDAGLLYQQFVKHVSVCMRVIKISELFNVAHFSENNVKYSLQSQNGTTLTYWECSIYITYQKALSRTFTTF